MIKTLNLNDDDAFLRGVEMADDMAFEAFIETLTQMRKVNVYSNQDIDKRMTARHALSMVRKIGNTPLR